jgi:hypothetical protein
VRGFSLSTKNCLTETLPSSGSNKNKQDGLLPEQGAVRTLGAEDLHGHSKNGFEAAPATVREQLREALKSMHVGQLMILQHFGNIPHELTLKNTQLFAQEVMPYMKDLWTEWKDRWYPKPMAETTQTRQAAQAL